MTINEAVKNVRDLAYQSNLTEDEEFIFTESLSFLIEKTNDPKYMMELGGYYYEKQNFDLAIKYYEMAALQEYVPAFMGLGYIWYYGRTGEKDYKKAFEYYEKARIKGDPISAYKVADMYKNGYYVEKDYERYKKIITELYDAHKDDISAFSIIPEIYTRLAKIKIEEGKNDQARSLLEEAKETLAERITMNGFFGNFTIMKWLIKDLYKVKDFDPSNFDFYDLYFVLETPHKISFVYDDNKYEIESTLEDGGIVIRFGKTWYRDIDDFMKKANIDGENLSTISYELENFQIEEK